MGEVNTPSSFLVISLVLLILVLSISNVNSVSAEQFLLKIPSGPTLPNVRNVAVDSSGNIYGTTNEIVVKFDSSGNVLLEFGSRCNLISNEISCVDPDGGGPLELGDGQFKEAEGVAIDSSGNIFVADRNNRIQKFDPQGNFVSKFGSRGSGDGQFNDSLRIVLDNSDNIYVSDPISHRIQIFDSNGNFIKMFGWGVDTGANQFEICTNSCQGGIFGSGDGQFRFPNGIALDSSGNIYVADRINQRIQIFDTNGNFIKMFGWGVDTGAGVFEICTSGCQVGLNGSGDGQLNDPRGIALDSSGNIFVGDHINSRIQKFDSSGNFVSKFGSSGTGDGQFGRPEGVAINSSGHIFVADEFRQRIQEFDSAGNFVSKFGSGGIGEGRFSQPKGMALDGSDNIYVLDRGNDRIQKFDSAGNFVSTFGWGVKTGAIVFEICTSGCQAGLQGSGDGQFNGPNNMALDSSGNIYVAEIDNERIQKFDSSLSFQGWMGKCTAGSNCDVGNQRSNGFSCTAATCIGLNSDSGDGQFNSPRGIVFDSSGNIYVLESGNDRIQKFDSSGNFVSKFGSNGQGDGQFSAPRGIALDSTGNIYVTETNEDIARVQKFDSDGVFQGWMGKCTSGINCDVGNQKSNGFSCTAATCSGLGADSGDGQFNEPKGIVFDSSDNIYVIDPQSRIQKFDSAGNFVSKFGSLGNADGHFFDLSGIALDSFGNIYLSDSVNNRIQKFLAAPCVIPNSGDMDISESCVLSASVTVPANISVQNNSIIVIPSGLTLTIPAGSNITILSGGGLLIEFGGALIVVS